MADKKLTYTVQAKDDASAVMQKIGSTAKREMGKVQDEFDDAGSAGKQFARILDQMADDLDENLTRSQHAADRLGQALGPDLREKIGQNGIDGFVQDMRRAGLSFDDIEQDADELAASIRKLDAVADKAGTATADGFHKVAAETDEVAKGAERAHGAMGGFVGGAVGELPGVANALGPIAEGLGQLAEGAFDAELGFKQIAIAGGAMALVGFAISKVTSELARNAEFAQREKQEIEDLAKSINEGSTAAEALTKHFEDLGKVQIDLPFHQSRDLTTDLDKLGLTVQQFSDLASGSQDRVEQWADEMRAAGADAGAMQVVLVALGAEHRRLSDAQDYAAVTSRVLGRNLTDAADSSSSAALAQDDLADATDGATGALERQNDALDALFDPMFAAVRAQQQAAAAQQRLTDLIDSGTASTDDLTQANLDVAEAQLGVDSAMRTLRQGIENGTVSVAAMHGQLQQWVTQGRISEAQAYAIAVSLGDVTVAANAIPPSKSVWVTTFGVDQAIADLQALQRTAAGVGENSYEVDVHSRVSGARASGGSVMAGQSYVVGEKGPELLTMGSSSGYVTPNEALAGVGGMSVTFGDIIIQGSHLSGQDVVNALKAWIRSNGPSLIRKELGV